MQTRKRTNQARKQIIRMRKRIIKMSKVDLSCGSYTGFDVVAVVVDAVVIHAVVTQVLVRLLHRFRCG